MAWMTDEQYELMQDTRDKAITARSARHTRTHCGKGGAVKFPSDYLSAKELKSMNGEVIKYASLKKPMVWSDFKVLPNDLAVAYIKDLRKKYNVPNNALAKMFGVSPAVVCRYFQELKLAEGKGTGGKREWDKDGFLAWAGMVEVNEEKPVETLVEEFEEQISELEAEAEVHAEEVEAEGTDEIEEDIEDIEIVSVDLADEIGPEAAARVEKLLHKAVEIINGCEEDEPENGPDECQCECTTNCAIPTTGEMSFEGNIDDILRTVRNLLGGKRVKLEVEWECYED